MNENKFIQKFQNKTDSELEYILDNKNSYNDQAISASIQILKDRNGQSEKLTAIEKDIALKKEKKEENKIRAIEKEKKESNLTDDPNAPELHSKTVIYAFSVIFSTIFGAILLHYNLKQTNNTKGKNQVLLFGILYTAFTIITINLIGPKGNLAIIFNLGGAAILSEYFWNKFLGKEIKHRKRSWIKPAIISVIVTIPFILAVIYGG